MHAVRILIGFTTGGLPVYTMRGGAPEGEGEGTGSEADDGAEEDDSEDSKEDDYEPPTKEEWARYQAAMKKANGEAASRRKWLEANGINPRTGVRYDAEEEGEGEEEIRPKPKAKAKSADSEEDPTQAVTSAELARLEKLRRTEGKKAAAREAQLVSALTKAAAQNALRTAGWNGKGASIVDRMIDLGEVEIDDEGNVVGLDDQIAEVKAEMPDWFKPVRGASKSRGTNGSGAREVDGSDKGTTKTAEKPKSWIDRLADQFDGEE